MNQEIEAILERLNIALKRHDEVMIETDKVLASIRDNMTGLEMLIKDKQ